MQRLLISQRRLDEVVRDLFLTPIEFGCVPGDPGFDNRPGMQAAFDAARNRKLELNLMRQRWYFKEGILESGVPGLLKGGPGLHVYGGDFDCTGLPMYVGPNANLNYVIKCQGAPASIAIPLLDDAKADSGAPVRLRVPLGTIEAYSLANDVVLYIGSNQVLQSAVRLGQTIRIKDVSTNGSEDLLELYGPVRFNFLKDDAAYIQRLNQARDISFRDFKLKGAAPLVVTVSNARQGGILFADCRDVILDNVTSERFTNGCITFERVWRGTGTNVVVKDAASWYGVQVNYSSRHVTIDGLDGGNTRHPFTTGSANSATMGSGMPGNVNVSNFISESRAAGMDTHLGWDVNFSDGYVNCAGDPAENQPSGVLMRCLSGSVTNVHITGHAAIGCTFQPLIDATTGCKATMSFKNVTFQSDDPRSDRNHAIGVYSNPGRVPISEVSIEATARGPWAGFARIQANGADIEVVRLRGSMAGFARSGVYAYATGGASIKRLLVHDSVLESRVVEPLNDAGITLRADTGSTINAQVDNTFIGSVRRAVRRWPSGGTVHAKIDVQTDALDLTFGIQPGDVWKKVAYEPIVGGDMVGEPFVRPEWFGAAANGTTDDTEAFNAAFETGRPVHVRDGKRYKANINVPDSSASPGLFCPTGVATIVTGTTDEVACLVVQKPDGFTVMGVFFDLPVSTHPVNPPASGAGIRFVPSGGIGTRYVVEGCRFKGGTNGVTMQGVSRDGRIENNKFEGTWKEGISVQCPQDFDIVGNTLKDGGYGGPSGAIRTGYSAQAEISLNLLISDNKISRYCENSGQSSIDCFSGGARNIRITDNFMEDCGSGIELKTVDWDGEPDVYEGNVVSGNTIRLKHDVATGGIHIQQGSPGTTTKGKARKVTVEDNFVYCSEPATSGLAHYGIVVLGHDHATIKDNDIIDVCRGITLGGNGTDPQLAEVIVVEGNTVDAIDSAIDRTGSDSTIDDLFIHGNPLLRCRSADSAAVRLNVGTTTNARIIDNWIENTLGAALEIRDVQDSRVTENTLVGATSAVVSVTTAPSGVKFKGNDVIAATGPAFNFAVGTGLEVQDNDVEVPIGSRTVSGAGTWTAARNCRGMATSDPSGTAGGSLGDFFDNSAAGAGDDKLWRCTTDGAAGVAVFTGAL